MPRDLADPLRRAVVLARMLGWRSVPNGIGALVSLERIPAGEVVHSARNQAGRPLSDLR